MDRLVRAIDAGDARAAAETFADDGLLVRFRGKDARGPSGVEPVLAQAFDICKMHAVGILERESSAVVQIASRCAHPEMKNEQNHLLVIDVDHDRIERAAVLTELFGRRHEAGAPVRRELEDPASLTPRRAEFATCTIDAEKKLLPADFGHLEREVWATPSCTVLTVRGDGASPSAHGYVEIACGPPASSCTRTEDTHRYVDWNGYRLLPFADEVYRAAR